MRKRFLSSTISGTEELYEYYKQGTKDGGNAMDETILRQAGIDYDAALARFVGKRAIYEKYLMKFLEDRHAQEAMRAYEEKDFNELLELTHALKGVAGTLGMTDLYDVSAEIVHDLRTDKLEDLNDKMNRMLVEQKRISEIIASA